MGDPDQPVFQRCCHVGAENQRRQIHIGHRKEMRDYRSCPERQYSWHGGKFETGLVGHTASVVFHSYSRPRSVIKNQTHNNKKSTRKKMILCIKSVFILHKINVNFQQHIHSYTYKGYLHIIWSKLNSNYTFLYTIYAVKIYFINYSPFLQIIIYYYRYSFFLFH